MFTKKIIYILIVAGCFLPFSVLAQIAINTENPQSNALLHIDSKKNNATIGIPTSAETADDVVVTTAGNVGIGTITPTTKLHLSTGGTATTPNPQLRIEDGAQGIDKVLTSDAQGKGRWAIYAPGAVLGTFSTTGINIPGIQSTFLNTGCKISLPPGKWAIIYSIVLTCSYTGAPPAGYKLWVRSTIGDTSTATTSSSDIFGNTLFCNTIIIPRKGAITGRCLVNNQTSVSKDYYLLVGYIGNGISLAGITFPGVGKKGDSGSFYAFRIVEN